MPDAGQEKQGIQEDKVISTIKMEKCLSMEWFEVLPEQCPPENAFEPNNELFYRIVRSENIESSDFIS
ncbi:hypothetical protein Barb4_01738 [Bacteroidales bacterium Barb4]|nr:hypothetical protein Barb4_01738 [Bacteroidales bacterium Barb4]